MYICSFLEEFFSTSSLLSCSFIKGGLGLSVGLLLGLLVGLLLGLFGYIILIVFNLFWFCYKINVLDKEMKLS